jgi:hypothetical protein
MRRIGAKRPMSGPVTYHGHEWSNRGCMTDW